MIATTTPSTRHNPPGITTPNPAPLPARLPFLFGGKIQTMQNFFILESAQ
jgi:hypothetical protein